MSISSLNKIEKMKVASTMAAQCLDEVEIIIKAGTSTEDIDQFCVNFLKNREAVAGALNYCGFPKSVCVSVNQEVCHGIPSKNTILKEGDLVKVDFVVKKDGYFGDTCRSYIVGSGTPLREKLRRVAYEAMWVGIRMVKDGVNINDIGTAIEQHSEKAGFTSVRSFCGHGIGEAMHMPPQMPHFNNKTPGATLKEGMFFTIEPMINAGEHRVKILKDKWTVVTADSTDSAQWEHTIMVLKDGYEVLTLSQREKDKDNAILLGKLPWDYHPSI